jgi:hypothetical protein
VDYRAAIAALLGVAFGTAIGTCAPGRQWLEASAIGALGTALVLGVVTQGNQSQLEHRVVLAVQLVAAIYFLAASTKAWTRRDNHPR